MNSQKYFCGLALVGLLSGPASAENWEPFTGAERLTKFVAGATAEFEYKPGQMATGTYNADGTAVITAYDGKFRRTWRIEGDDQVCYTTDIKTNCYRFENNLDDPDEFRAVHVDGTKSYLFRVVDREAKVYERETPAGADGSLSSPSAAEVAAELANPNTTLGTMNFFIDYTAFQGDLPGADSANASKLSFQPGMPYPLTDTANLFVRPLFPIIIKQDVPGSDGFEEKSFELGDITYDIAVFNSSPTGLIYGGGVAGAIPTATDDALGLDQWLLGPEVIVALMRPWGVIGMIASHQWDVAGSNKNSTSVTGGQYFYSFNVKNGWVFGAGPTFSYNHKADSDNKWTFPIGIGGSKTALIGGRAWKFGLQYWYYVASPDDFGPQHLLRLQVAPVIKLPW